jgi:hypothetical protein
MVIRGRRSDNRKKFYYHCSRVAHAHVYKPCSFRKFVPGAWDEAVWDAVYAILKDDSLIQSQLSELTKQHDNIDKLIKLEQQKINQAQAKMAKVREGFEGGLYSLDEAKIKINSYQEAIARAEQEITALKKSTQSDTSTFNTEVLKQEFKRLAQINLENATYAEKQDVISKLGIKVYPSEDLKTMRIRCKLNIENESNNGASGGCVIVQLGSSLRSSQ